MQHVILRAEPPDAPALLALQRLAYQSEAALYGTTDIPPLTQTLEELRAEFNTCVVLKAVDQDGQIIGSVRGHVENSDATCHLGRLMVHPAYQRQGLGSALVRAVEACFPQARRFSLFTGSRSEGNLRLYTRLGYQAVRNQVVNPGLTLIFLERKTP